MRMLWNPYLACRITVDEGSVASVLRALFMIAQRNNKKRVLYIYPALPVGGAEKQLYLLVKNLDKERYTPYVCCLVRGGPVADMIRELGVEVIQAQVSDVYDVRAVWRIKKIIAEKKIDIVQTCLFGFDLFANIAGYFGKAKVILSTRRERAIWKQLHHKMLQHAANMFVDRIIVNSRAVRDFVLLQERVSPDRIITIYNGIEVAEYAAGHSVDMIKRELAIEPDRMVIGVVSNFGAYKGHPYLLRAAQIVAKKVPNALFLLIGDGPHLQTCIDQANDLHLEQTVRFLGLRHDVHRLLALCDVFAFPSLTEGFPNAVLEAQCARVPVVATNVGGIPEIITDGMSGLLVPPADHNALARGIERLCEDRKLAGTLADNGRRSVAERFSAGKMAAAYAGVYDALLASGIH